MQFFSRIRSGIGAIVPLAQGRALTFRKGAALPEGDTGGPTERPNGASPSGTPSDGVHLDLEKTSLAIEDGLLMVLGPQGDPVPPAAFAAAAADQPLASLALPHGTRVAARRVAVVLEAQARGPLAQTPESAGAWIRAMVGAGEEPQAAAPEDLRAEAAGEHT